MYFLALDYPTIAATMILDQDFCTDGILKYNRLSVIGIKRAGLDSRTGMTPSMRFDDHGTLGVVTLIQLFYSLTAFRGLSEN